MKRTFTLALLSTLLLQGCVWSPGQYLHRDDLKTNGSIEGTKVELIPITSAYLKSHDSVNLTADTGNWQELLKYHPAAYRVGKADLLYITVWDHPELTAPSGAQQQIEANGRLVRPDGTIFYPYVGTLTAEGKTLEEIRKVISTRLATFIDNPQVDVSVLRFGSQKVTLSGAFTKGDSIPLTTVPMTLVEALGQANVDTQTADLSGLTLVRDGKEYRLDADTLNRKDSKLYGVYLKDGDSIHLPYNDNRKVYVMGEVRSPLAANFKTTSLTLMDALGQAGGLNQETADADEVYVIRGPENFNSSPAAKAQVFHLSASSPTAFVLAQHFALQPQDVVFVGPAGITRWNRFVSQLLGSSNVLSSTANANQSFK